jgi:DNA-binding CsgD family transcriptional regulator
MILENLNPTNIADGYTYDSADGLYTCTVCGAGFGEGEVYPVGDGRYLLAEKAVAAHMRSVHGDRLTYLLGGESKYISLTANQKDLLLRMAQGESDTAIASALGVAPSTVRHQRFMFREKAKQAKMYLAIYALAMEKGEGELMAIHNDTVKVDDRFIITEQEREKIIKGAFSSVAPLKLRQIPPKEKKKIVVLGLIATSFEKGRRYPEKEINAILRDIHEDYVTLRRYLIEYGYLDRQRDCSEYWVK